MNTLGMPLQEAIEISTGAEIRAAEKRLGVGLDDDTVTSTDVMVAVAWIHDRRRAFREGQDRPTWEEINEWTLRELRDYFTEEEVEIDPERPETIEGKDDSPEDVPLVTEPSLGEN